MQEARHHRGAADEGAEQGGEAGQGSGEREAAERDCRQGEGRKDAGKPSAPLSLFGLNLRSADLFRSLNIERFIQII